MMDFQSRSMNLIVSLPRNSYELAQAAFDNGADAVKVHINVEHRASGNFFGSLKDEEKELCKILQVANNRPVGIVLGGSYKLDRDEVETCRDMGFSFMSLYADHFPAWLLEVDGWGKMASPNYTYSDEEIFQLGKSGIDMLEASIMRPDQYGQPLLLSDLVLYKKIRSLVDIPLVIPSQKRLVPSDVKHLASVGIDAVMIGAVVTGADSAQISEATLSFRKAVDDIG